MLNFFFRLLSREWAGLLIAAVLTLSLLAVVQGMRLASDELRSALSLAALTPGILLSLGALFHLYQHARICRVLPPTGRLIDIGGYRVHVLAEGEAPVGAPAIVWFAGGHAGGFAIHHLHRALRNDTRSILIDRPGTGWSDTGPFPRTTAREAEEMVLALERAGEKGPFIWAGHSFGGLLCANIARRHPELVHTLVLLDPTPLETILFGPRFSAIREMQRSALIGGLAQLFGIDIAARQRMLQAQDPVFSKIIQATETVLGPEVLALRDLDARAGAHFAQASIYRELSPEGAAACAFETVVYDGDLGNLAVLLVGPQNDIDVQALPEANTSDAAHSRYVMRRLAATRERYLAISTRSQRIIAPAGTGHNFIYEVPEWVAQVMRSALLRKD
ncbi:MAG: alpha/beta hydrolase [Burkholderiales bacterium]